MSPYGPINPRNFSCVYVYIWAKQYGFDVKHDQKVDGLNENSLALNQQIRGISV